MESSKKEGQHKLTVERNRLFMSALLSTRKNVPAQTPSHAYKNITEDATVDSKTAESAHDQICNTKPSLSRSVSYPAANSENSKISYDGSPKDSKFDHRNKFSGNNLRNEPRKNNHCIDYQKEPCNRSIRKHSLNEQQESNKCDEWGDNSKPICSIKYCKEFNSKPKNLSYQNIHHSDCQNGNAQASAINKEQTKYKTDEKYNNRDSHSFLYNKSSNNSLRTQYHNFRHQKQEYDKDLHSSDFRYDNVDKKQMKQKNDKYISNSFRYSNNKNEKFRTVKDFNFGNEQNDAYISTSVPSDDDKDEDEPEIYCEFKERTHTRDVFNADGTFKITFCSTDPSELLTAIPSAGHDSEISDISLKAENRTSDDGGSLYVQSLSDKNHEALSASALSLNTSNDSGLCDVLCENSFINSPNSNYLQHQNLFLAVETAEYIPPPIPPPAPPKNNFNTSENVSCDSVLKENEIVCSNHVNTSAVTDILDIADNETYSSICEPDSKQLEAITSFICGIVKEKSVSISVADKVVCDLNVLFKDHLEGNTIDVYGSYYTELAITTSDINLVMKADDSIRRSFMFEVYKVLAKEQNQYIVHPFEEADYITKVKILFSEPTLGVNCELAYLGKYEKNYRKMGSLLRAVCSFDKRVKILIIATKIWAEECLMNDVEEGKLHSIGFVMMVIHFLQQYDKPVLPAPIIVYPNGKLESPPSPTSSSIGELWLALLKYFAVIFDWTQDVITITSKEPVPKISKGWGNFWIAIEDPFTGKNIAQSVKSSDTADFIKAFFKYSYEYFYSPPVDSSSSTDEDNASKEGSSSSKWQYSFQQCMVDQSEFSCEVCSELDDICDDCKSKICAPPIRTLPSMTEDFLKKIREVLYLVKNKYLLTDDDVQERKSFVKYLKTKICQVYSDADLQLFGSSANGFGFKISDLDICMTVNERERKNINTTLRDISRILKRIGDFDHICVISSATIPIIKFHYKPKGWRGDLCVNNTLALYNSKLLYNYSLLDERCKILGCALKLMTKKALIADVADKTLSSYSYLIMVIHFLQQTNPQILPVLQDKKEFGSEYKPNFVDDWNVWFFEDSKWLLDPSTNKTPVEQLWLDLLDYYCSYDKKYFITIRQKEPMILSDGQISARLFNIQDPFIENKNLGCVVAAKKAQETANVFERARLLFRTPKETNSITKDTEEYFFSTMSLTGRIHKEVFCDFCGKYNHEKKDCRNFTFPLRKNNFGRFPKRNFNQNRHPVQRNSNFKSFNSR